MFALSFASPKHSFSWGALPLHSLNNSQPLLLEKNQSTQSSPGQFSITRKVISVSIFLKDRQSRREKESEFYLYLEFKHIMCEKSGTTTTATKKYFISYIILLFKGRILMMFYIFLNIFLRSRRIAFSFVLKISFFLYKS